MTLLRALPSMRSVGHIGIALVALTMLFFLDPNQAAAEVVRYTDSLGQVHYVDSPSKVPAEYRDQLKQAKPLPAITRDRDLKLRGGAEPAAAKPAQKAEPRVELYVTSWCPYCTALERTLTENKVNFVRYDIERSAEGKRKHSEAGGGGIPVTKVGDTIIRGNNPGAILRALGR